jgi:hypothetical protein
LKKLLFFFSKVFLLLNAQFALYSGLYAQPIIISWQQCYGGSDVEGGANMSKTNYGYLVLANTYSNDGQISGNHGGEDVVLLSVDSTGNFLNSTTYGGSADDSPVQILSTLDNGYILLCETFSNDGSVQGNHGDIDFWVVKIDSVGGIQWQKCFGGSSQDMPGRQIIETIDTSYLILGSTASVDGDVSGNHGIFDFWLVKLDKNGNILFQKCYGGSNIENGRGMNLLCDGGMLLYGFAGSHDGDVQCDFHGGLYDAWIVKVDSGGQIIWERCYGGSGRDVFGSIVELPDSTLVCVGITDSNDGQVSGNHGSWDIWLVNIDSDGNIIWQKCIGGSKNESCIFGKISSDTNIFIGGETYSNDGNVSGNHSLYPAFSDGWLVKLSREGNLMWQLCLGGEGNENVGDEIELGGGKITVLGCTEFSNNTGNVSCNIHGASDVWLLSLLDTSYYVVTEKESSSYFIKTYPNPSSQYVVFEYSLPKTSKDYFLTIEDDLGRIVDKLLLSEPIGRIYWGNSNLVPGIYYYHLFDNSFIFNGKIILL